MTDNQFIPETSPTTESDNVAVHTLDEDVAKPLPSQKIKLTKVFGIVLVIFLGISTGYFLAGRAAIGLIPNTSLTTKGTVERSQPVEVVGSGCSDTATFSDQATGELATNDRTVVKEGTHKLIRPGGKDQTAYLFSSVMDLDPYIGRQVTVRGETFSAKQAGWLMDVGCVEIL